jgi:DNA-directed RNA polymerase subunit RPC12/RpoP
MGDGIVDDCGLTELRQQLPFAERTMKETARQEVGRCHHCGTPIWSDHPYAWCSECGERLPDDIKAAFPRAQSPRAETGTALEVEGKAVPCPICGHDRFWTRKTLMDTRGASLFGVDWVNPTAMNYICNRCGHVLWFLRR